MYKKIDVLERPTSACHLISWAIFCQYNTIHVVKFPDFSLILKDFFPLAISWPVATISLPSEKFF